MFYLKRQSESPFLLLFIVCLHVKREQCLNFYVRFLFESHIQQMDTSKQKGGTVSDELLSVNGSLCVRRKKMCLCASASPPQP